MPVICQFLGCKALLGVSPVGSTILSVQTFSLTCIFIV